MKSSTIPTLLIALQSAALGLAWIQNVNAAPLPASRGGMAELGDPYVAPHVKARARAMGLLPMTTGSKLQTQALGKLRNKFNAADSEHSGWISRSQAQGAGFGYVVNHFDEIDRQRRGRISFEELKGFLRANGAVF